LCPHRKRELFVTGHLPEERCDWHREVCGAPAVVYPPRLQPWLRAARGVPSAPQQCAADAADATALRITAPVDGARFVLEPHRPAAAQRPPLAAVPASGVRWTIDGEPAEQWIPRPGAHRVVASRADRSAAVTIHYE
jgi:hypothetical protein